MEGELDRFDSSCRELIKFFLIPLEAVTPPDTIYHYTDANGLRGILDSGTVWLSDIFMMNDPTELAHGFAYMAKEVDSLRTQERPETGLFACQLHAFAEQGGLPASAHYFACSFSREGDNLPQWTLYADKARGYVLAFDTRPLERAFIEIEGATNENRCTFPVTYDGGIVRRLQEQIVKLADPLISFPRGRKLDGEQITAYMGELSTILCVHALRASLYFKNESYRHEAEYRFLELHRGDIPAPQTKSRGSREAPTRYREFDWKSVNRSALREVMVGPAAATEDATQFAQQCLRRAQLNDVPVIRSSVPFRLTPGS